MAAGLSWSRRDKKRAQHLVKQLAEKFGGWQGLADELGMESESSRAVVHAWHSRGRVPLVWAAPVRDLARGNGIDCTLSELSPQAKHLENMV